MTQRYTTDEELRHRAAYHPPQTDETIQAHETVRANIVDLTLEWNAVLPEGREKSQALAFLDQAMWAANAAIARGHALRSVEDGKFVPVADNPQA